METPSIEFWENLKRLYRWYGRKDATDDQLEVWQKRIGYIPGKILGELVDQIIDTAKYMPTPGEMKRLYSEYKSQHYDKFLPTDQEEEYCRYCESKGYFDVWKQEGSMVYWVLLPCGHCRNWRRVFPTKGGDAPKRLFTKDEISETGYSLSEPPNFRTERRKKEYDSVSEMAENVGLDMPEEDELPF